MPPVLVFLAGPILGAIIGYFTNDLAVRMLFRPLSPKYIGRFRLPFTPGIIPKRKPALARALGAAVGQRLLTGEDLASLILTPEALDSAAGAAADAVTGEAGQAVSSRLAAATGEERFGEVKASLDRLITDAILRTLGSLDLGSVIVTEGGDAIRQSAPPLVSMFLGDKFLDSLAAPIGEHVKSYLAESGESLILPAVAAETERLLALDGSELLASIGSGREQIKALAKRVCESFLKDKIASVLSRVDIAGAVEKRIDGMDTAELERLILSVMKHELNAIVRLGALLGFLLGFLTVLF